MTVAWQVTVIFYNSAYEAAMISINKMDYNGENFSREKAYALR